MVRGLAEQLLPLFEPRTIALVGASNRPGKWGHSLMERPLKGGLTGTVIPVNPGETEVMGLPAYASVLTILSPSTSLC